MAGTYTSYTITANFGLSSCLGPDGRVWKITSNDKSVYAVSVTGTPTSTTYAVNIGTPDFTDGTICTDRTYVWVPMRVNATGAPYVARVTMAGVVTIFALAAGGGTPGGCCLGADGRVWITATSTPYGAWAVVPSTGASTWYPLPLGTASTGQSAATLGPDGNVYAPDTAVLDGTGAVWQITTAGVWTLFTGVGTNPLNSQMAFTDTSGNMWFCALASGSHGALLFQCLPLISMGACLL